MEAATSFTSRRPAAGSLPAFTLPPPTSSEIPRAGDGISPSLSSINTGSSQGSQPAGMQYTYGHGTWPTPGSSSYNVHHATQHQQPLGQGQYGGRPTMYNQPPSMPFSHSRNSQSPATGGEGLPAPPYDQVHQPFQTPVSGGGSGQAQHHQNMASHPPTPSSAPAHVDSYAHTRPPSNPGYYSTSPYHQQSPTHPSPHTSGPGSRGLNSMAGPGPAMAPPAPYRPYPPYQQQQMSGLPGPIMSNIHQPGAQMSILPGMNVPAGYGAPPMMYGATQPVQTERPFKCDQCTQSFSRNHDLKRHKRIHLSVKPFPCTFCAKSFSRKDALKRHRLVKGCESKNRDGTNGDDAGSDKNGDDEKD